MKNTFRSPRSYGISTILCGPGGGGLHVENNRFLEANAARPFNERTAIAILMGDKADNEVLNNRSTYMKHFLVAQGGSHLIAGNHCFQGMLDDGTTTHGHNPNMVFTVDGRIGCTIVGNYIDNGGILVQQAANANTDVGWMIITGNLFCYSFAGANQYFVKIEMARPDSRIVNTIITNNDFRNAGDTLIRPLWGDVVGSGSFNRSQRRECSG